MSQITKMPKELNNGIGTSGNHEWSRLALNPAMATTQRVHKTEAIMKRTRIAGILAFLLACLSLKAQEPPAVSILIENPSFEPTAALVITDRCGLEGWTMPGWDFSAGSGVFQPNSCDIASPPDGVTVGYAGYGSAFSQTLSTKPAEGVYVLKFSVANYFPSYPGYYEAKLSFGTQELCDTSGWGTRTFTEITLVCPSSGYLIVDKALPAGGPAQGSNNLAITFSAPGWTVLFDDVSLTFTPEPK